MDDKFIVLDILVLLDDGTRIDVEMQATRRPAWPERALYYWARTFSSQLERGQPYSALRPVVSVHFLDYVELDTPRFHSTFRLLEVHEHFPFSDALELHVIELPKRNQPLDVTRQEDADLLAWTRFLGATSDEEVKEACMSNPAIAKTNEVLSSLSVTPSAQELVRRRQLALDTYQIEMGAMMDALTKSHEKGRAEARVELLRTTIVVLAEALGIELDQARKHEIEGAPLADLEALWTRLAKEHHW